MNREAWLHIVQEARNGNETLFNRVVTSNFREHFYKSIIKIVHDEDLTMEIYNSTMFKFWERFIHKGEDLPGSNIDGYIFQMSRNAYYEIGRQRNNQRNLNTVSMESQEIIEKYKDVQIADDRIYKEFAESDDMKMHRVLFDIVQSLDEVCQQIIRRNIIDEQSLVKLKEELKMYGSYNAIVQKKKRCMNMLTKLLTRAIKEKKYILPQNQR